MRAQGIPIEDGAEERALKEGGYYKWSATWCTPSVKKKRRNTEAFTDLRQEDGGEERKEDDSSLQRDMDKD